MENIKESRDSDSEEYQNQPHHQQKLQKSSSANRKYFENSGKNGKMSSFISQK